MERTGLEPASTDGNFQETRFLTTYRQMGTTPISDNQFLSVHPQPVASLLFQGTSRSNFITLLSKPNRPFKSRLQVFAVPFHLGDLPIIILSCIHWGGTAPPTSALSAQCLAFRLPVDRGRWRTRTPIASLLYPSFQD